MANENIIPDGNTDFSAGQDSSRSADKVQENGYFAGINVNTKNGTLSPRFGWEEIELTFPDGGIGDRSWKTIFSTGRYHAATPYIIGQDKHSLIVINGIIFIISEATGIVKVLNLDGQQIDPTHKRVNLEFGDETLVIHDFPNYPALATGLTVRRADPLKQEVPVSKNGIANNLRLWVTNNGNEFTAGDPIGSLAAPNAPTTFKEILTLGSDFYGQIFKPPVTYQYQDITALGFLQQTDSSTGIGPLLVSLKNALIAYHAELPRENWNKVQFSSVLLYNRGFAGQMAQVNVNSDLFFMASDGSVSSLAMSRDEQQKYSHVPISREVEKWLKFQDVKLAEYAVLGYFENRVFISANPFYTPAFDNYGNRTFDVAHGGIVVLEFDNITNFGSTGAATVTGASSGKPVWAGLWTGVRPLGFIKFDESFYIVGKDGSNINKLYRVRPDLTYDIIGNQTRYIKSRVYTRDYIFKDPLAEKELLSVDLGIEKVAGDFQVDIQYKPGHSDEYKEWKTFKHAVKWRWTGAIIAVCGFVAQAFKNITFGLPKPEYDSVTKEPLHVFRRLGLKLDITGKNWELHTVKVNAKILPPVANNTTTVDSKSKVTNKVAQCNNDWYLEENASCQTPTT